MRAARIVSVVGVIGLVAGGVAWWVNHSAAPADVYRTATVERTDVRRTVTATGPLAAVKTVEVGTQVSGILTDVLVDFNARVTRGQPLAHLDTTLLDADVATAGARVAEAQAGRDRLALESARVERLHTNAAATDQELEVARADLAVADAQLRTARVALDRATRNRGYATITSPIDGTIIRRDKDPGQTVNAGLSAPTLFLIAGDLAQMQILVAVDESDIGQIHEGQDAEFTVQTWPDRVFTGKVRQVRLQSTTAESVVTYTAVVAVDNRDGALLPGMTATVQFIIGKADGVLCVANAALRFRPDDAPEAGEDAGGRAGAGHAGPPSGGGPDGGRRRRGADSTEGTLWTASGAVLQAIPVHTGLRGQACTEVSGDGVTDGMTVVVGVDHSAASAPSSPLQQTAPPRRPGGF